MGPFATLDSTSLAKAHHAPCGRRCNAATKHASDQRFWESAGCSDLGLGFVFEHPRDGAVAVIWDEPCVQEIMMRDSTYTAEFDQCRFGLVSPGGSALRKPTMLMTNIISIYYEFHDMHCNCGDRSHRRIEGFENGTSVAAFAARYPPGMVDAIVRACP